MTEVATTGGAPDLVTSEKAAWFRIVSDLETELSAVRSQLDAKEERIRELTNKHETEKVLRGRFEEKAERLAAELKLAKEGNDRSSSAASSSHSTVPPGLPASRSHEIEAWMDICSTLALSKPTFSGGGALHQSTLRAVLEAVKQTKMRETQRGVELETLKKKTMASGSRARSEDGESLPSGFDDSQEMYDVGGQRRVGFSGSASVGGGRQFRTAKSAAELCVVRWADSAVDCALASLSDKFDMVVKSVALNIGEPRWRGPKAQDGARWAGTWDSVVGSSSPSSSHHDSPPKSMAQQNEQILHMMQQLLSNQNQQQHQQVPNAASAADHSQREFLQQQIQQQLTQQQHQRAQNFHSAGNSAGPQAGARGSSPTSWRRVLDSQPQQQLPGSLHPSNYHHPGRNAVLVGDGGGRIGAGNRGMMVSPGRGPVNTHQHYYNQQQHAKNSPPRNQSPLGNSGTIRQILERMQLERTSFARSRSGSPAQHQQPGESLEPYRFVSKAIRRSQSPPSRDDREHYHFQPQGQQPSATRFIPVPSPFNVGGGMSNSRPKSAMPSQRYSGRRW